MIYCIGALFCFFAVVVLCFNAGRDYERMKAREKADCQAQQFEILTLRIATKCNQSQWKN